jgi:hypothetical protein
VLIRVISWIVAFVNILKKQELANLSQIQLGNGGDPGELRRSLARNAAENPEEKQTQDKGRVSENGECGFPLTLFYRLLWPVSFFLLDS